MQYLSSLFVSVLFVLVPGRCNGFTNAAVAANSGAGSTTLRALVRARSTNDDSPLDTLAPASHHKAPAATASEKSGCLAATGGPLTTLRTRTSKIAVEAGMPDDQSVATAAAAVAAAKAAADSAAAAADLANIALTTLSSSSSKTSKRPREKVTRDGQPHAATTGGPLTIPRTRTSRTPTPVATNGIEGNEAAAVTAAKAAAESAVAAASAVDVVLTTLGSRGRPRPKLARANAEPHVARSNEADALTLPRTRTSRVPQVLTSAEGNKIVGADNDILSFTRSAEVEA